MTERNARPPIDEIDGAGNKGSAAASQTTLILTRPRDESPRAQRIRKWARRDLDDLLAVGRDPWRWAEPPDHDYWGDFALDMPAREARGAELGAVGWCP